MHRIRRFLLGVVIGASLVTTLQAQDGDRTIIVYVPAANSPVERIAASSYETGCYNGLVVLDHHRLYVTGRGYQAWFTYRQQPGARFVVEPAGGQTPPAAPPGGGGADLNSVEYVGTLWDLLYLPSFDPAACAQTCQAEPRCKAWTHRMHDKACLLFSAVHERKANPDTTSGERK